MTDAVNSTATDGLRPLPSASAGPLSDLDRTYLRQVRESEAVLRMFDAQAKELSKITRDANDDGAIPVAFVADDVGTGKTWVALITLYKLFAKEQRASALIIVPSKELAQKWFDTILEFEEAKVDDPGHIAIEFLRRDGQEVTSRGRRPKSKLAKAFTDCTAEAFEDVTASASLAFASFLKGEDKRPFAKRLSSAHVKRLNRLLKSWHEVAKDSRGSLSYDPIMPWDDHPTIGYRALLNRCERQPHLAKRLLRTAAALWNRVGSEENLQSEAPTVLERHLTTSPAGTLRDIFRLWLEHALLSSKDRTAFAGMLERLTAYAATHEHDGRESDDDFTLTPTDADDIMKGLSRYLHRLQDRIQLKNIVKKAFVPDGPLSFFSPAGVFTSAKDLAAQTLLTERDRHKLPAALLEAFRDTTDKAFATSLRHLAGLIRELHAFESHPARVVSPFWEQKLKGKTIKIVVMRDLPNCQVGSTTFDLTIVDEIHNWNNGKNGMSGFLDVRKATKRCLMMSATPIQLHEGELHHFLTLCQPTLSDDNLAACFAAIRQSQEKLTEHLLKAAESPAVMAVLRHHEDAVGSGKTSRNQAWEAMKNETGSVGELARAVLDLRAAVDRTGILLRRYFVKRPNDHRRRQFFCGEETSFRTDSTRPAVDEASPNDTLHPAPGLDPSEGFQLVTCMSHRLAGMKGVGLRPDGLLSSIEAFEESKAMTALAPNGNNDDDFSRYHALHRACLDESDLTHPKVNRTIELVVGNLLRGEKTLVFCERKETVKALRDKITKALNDLRPDLFGHAPSHSAYFDGLIADPAFVNALQSRNCHHGLAATQRQFDARVAWLMNVLADATDTVDVDRLSRLTGLKPALFSEAVGRKDREYLNEWLDKSDQMCTALQKEPVVMFTGDTETQRRLNLLHGFCSPGFPLVLIGSPVCQEGLDFHLFCRQLVLHDLHWNPAKLEQRVGRLDRVGSLASVTGRHVQIHVPFLKDTYEEFQYRIVLRRAQTAQILFGQNNASTDKSTKPSDAIDCLPDLPHLLDGFFDMDLRPREANEALIVVKKRRNGDDQTKRKEHTKRLSPPSHYVTI